MLLWDLSLADLRKVSKMEITYKNYISVEDFITLRDTVDWTKLHPNQVETMLGNSFHLIGAYVKEEIVGTARIVSDGGYLFFIADVIVAPGYQGKGIGRTMMNMLLQRVKEGLQDGYSACIALMSAKNVEGFYEKLGFHVRPNNKLGPGMTQWIVK